MSAGSTATKIRTECGNANIASVSSARPAPTRPIPRRVRRATPCRPAAAPPDRTARSRATPPAQAGKPRQNLSAGADAPAPMPSGPRLFCLRAAPTCRTSCSGSLAPGKRLPRLSALVEHCQQLPPSLRRHVSPPDPVAPLPVMHQLRRYRSSHPATLSQRSSRICEAPGATLTSITPRSLRPEGLRTDVYLQNEKGPNTTFVVFGP